METQRIPSAKSVNQMNALNLRQICILLAFLMGCSSTPMHKSSKAELGIEVPSVKEQIKLVDSWFIVVPNFIGAEWDSAAEHRIDARPIVLKLGDTFGFRTEFVTIRPRLELKVVLIVPHSPERFPASQGIVKFFKRENKVVVETSISGANGETARYWGIAKDDPIGMYELQYYLDGNLMDSFKFEVRK